MAKKSIPNTAKATSQTAEEKRAEARNLAERLPVLIGAEHTFLSEFLIESANQIPADSTPLSPDYVEQHGYFAARRAKPFEIAAAKLIERHKSKTDAGTIFNQQRLAFLEGGIGACSAASFMTQNEGKDYLNTALEKAFIGLRKDDCTLVVIKRPAIARNPFNMGMSTGHDSPHIGDMLKSMLPGFTIIDMRDDMENSNDQPFNIFDFIKSNGQG